MPENMGSNTNYFGYHSMVRYSELTEDMFELSGLLAEVDHAMIALIDALERLDMTMNASIEVLPKPIEQTGPEYPCPMEIDRAN